MEGLVDIFRNLKNPIKFGLVVGDVIADLPEIQIDIGNGIILDKEDLLFNAGILKDYERQYSIESEDTQLKGNKLDSDGQDFSFTATPAVMFDTLVVGATPPQRPVLTIPEGVGTVWSTKATNFDLDSQDMKSTGKITLTDEIVTGDKVALIASESQQLFLVICKTVSF